MGKACSGPRRVVGYSRVSTREQADGGYSLSAQREAIEAETARRGWQLVDVCSDEGLSGASLAGRNELVRAVRMIEAGHANVLMATKVDRVSRSVADFANLIKRAKDNSWTLVVMDLGLDLSTSTGKFVAHIMSAVAELERDMISDRTKDGLAAAKAQGVRLGSPVSVSDAVAERIVELRQAGATLTGIADVLNDERVPTSRGGSRWWPSTVRAVLARSA